jgi:hypothetical protein
VSLEEIVARFRERGFLCKEQPDGGVRCQCSGHGGTDLNLVMHRGQKGGIVVHCKVHDCSEREIMAGVGLTVADLMPPPTQPNGRDPSTAPVARYRYNDREGHCLFEVWRFDPKEFRPYHLAPDQQWKKGLPPSIPRVLYRLPELLVADPKEPVFIAAGEKDADNLAKRGLVAITNPLGEALKWRNRPEWTEPLKGRRCIVLEDRDPLDPKRGTRPGEEHAKEVFAALTEAGIEAKRLLLSGLSEGEDVSDWLKRGGTAEELKRMAAPEPHPLDLRVMDGEALERAELSTPEALIPHLLYRGFSTLLAGDSKLGKSSLLLRAILAGACGGWWLDRDRRAENRLPVSRILFVNFEDPLFVTRERGRKMMAPERLPAGFLTMEPPYGFRLAQILDWIASAHQRLKLDAVVLDPLAIAAEWDDETDNSEVARTLKAIQRLAAETHLALLSAHHVTKKPGERGLNIRGGSAIKANVLGYLVLEPDKLLFRLSGINKLVGEWDVTLDRTDRDWSWWIVDSRAGSTRTPQSAVKDGHKIDLLRLVRDRPGATTAFLAELLDLPLNTARDYLRELAAADLLFDQDLPRESGQMGNAPKGWFPWPAEGAD